MTKYSTSGHRDPVVEPVRGKYPAARETTPSVLALQQQAGNQAVNRLIAGRALPASASEAAEYVRNGAGQPLDASTRDFMEARFHDDFSQVRIHTGSKANETARAAAAAAYTIGRDVVFAAGRFQPSTQPGRRLLAHELAHVVQQARGRGRAPMTRTRDNAALDAEATHASDAVMHPNGAVGHLSAAPVGLACSRASTRLPPRDITPEEVQGLTRQLNEAIPESSRGRKTVAVGLVEDAQGHQPLVYTVNGNWSHKDLEARAKALGIERWQGTPRAEGRGEVGAPADAEQILMEIADQNRYKVVVLAPSRPACADCSAAIKSQGGIYLAEEKASSVRAPQGATPEAETATAPVKKTIGRKPAAASPEGATSEAVTTTPSPVKKTIGRKAAAPSPKGAAPEAVTPPQVKKTIGRKTAPPATSAAPAPKAPPVMEPIGEVAPPNESRVVVRQVPGTGEKVRVRVGGQTEAAPPSLAPQSAAPSSVRPTVQAPAAARSQMRARLGAGAKAAGKAVLTTALFYGLQYAVHEAQLTALEENLERGRAALRGRLASLKTQNPTQTFYLQVTVRAFHQDRYVPLLGWMPARDRLDLWSLQIVTSPVDPPHVDTQEIHDLLNPQSTTTVVYTEPYDL